MVIYWLAQPTLTVKVSALKTEQELKDSTRESILPILVNYLDFLTFITLIR